MYKKMVIVINKSLNMSHGKIAAMAMHGALKYSDKWFKMNISCVDENGNYFINPNAVIKSDYINWLLEPNVVVLEAENNEHMKKIVLKAQEEGLYHERDYFNVVDESTEFLGIPEWACIVFSPCDSTFIDCITGDLNLYGYENSSLSNEEKIDYSKRSLKYGD